MVLLRKVAAAAGRSQGEMNGLDFAQLSVSRRL